MLVAAAPCPHTSVYNLSKRLRVKYHEWKSGCTMEYKRYDSWRRSQRWYSQFQVWGWAERACLGYLDELLYQWRWAVFRQLKFKLMLTRSRSDQKIVITWRLGQRIHLFPPQQHLRKPFLDSGSAWVGKQCNIRVPDHQKCHLRCLRLWKEGENEYSIRLHENTCQKEPYAALSYIWGNLRLTDFWWAISMSLRIESTPKISPWPFMDAVKCAHELVLRYLWVDGLVHIQDSQEDQSKGKLDASRVFIKMPISTISAAMAKSCDEGFLGTRELVEKPCRRCLLFSFGTFLWGTNRKRNFLFRVWTPNGIRGKK